MDSYLLQINKYVAKFDREFFAKRDNRGIVRIYCNKYSYKPVVIDGSTTIYYPQNEPYHVFSLTDTWGYWGNPVAYGMLPLWQKLRQISFDNRDRLYKELEEDEKKAEERKKAHLSSLSNDMAHQARDVFKEATKDIVFNTIDKSNDPRRKQEKKLKEF